MAGRPIVFVNNQKASEINLHPGERLQISFKGKKIVAVSDIIKSSIDKEEILLSTEIVEYLNVKDGNTIDIHNLNSPKSIFLISKKLSGKELSKEEIHSIILDIVNNALSEAEIAYFVSAVYERGMTIKETIYLTEAIYQTGNRINWGNEKIVDKHSIGGIPGNRTTPIVVSICASAGLKMPKTSSRAITSAAGTADTMEILTKVDLSMQEVKSITEKVGACLAWGGSLGLAPADDKLIRVERLLNLDPESQLIASIMAKKLAVGSKYILIDIPYGKGAKVSKKEGLRLKDKFLKVAKYFKLHLKIVLTEGSQPIGNGIGPYLEVLDILKVLRCDKDAPHDLKEKSLNLAAEIFEMVNKTPLSQGYKKAKEILESKKALKKFNEIISAQGKKFHTTPRVFKHLIKSSKDSKVKEINNKEINNLSKIIGCPIDKYSGLYLYKHVGEKVNKGENLLLIQSESKDLLKEGIEYINKNKIIEI